MARPNRRRTGGKGRVEKHNHPPRSTSRPISCVFSADARRPRYGGAVASKTNPPPPPAPTRMPQTVPPPPVLPALPARAPVESVVVSITRVGPDRGNPFPAYQTELAAGMDLHASIDAPLS